MDGCRGWGLNYMDIFFKPTLFIYFCLFLYSPFFHDLLVPSLLKSVLKIQVTPPPPPGILIITHNFQY